MISYFWLLLLKCNTSKGEWAVPTWWPSSFQGMNVFALLNLGLFPSPQNKPKHLEILWGLFQEDYLFFSALTFLGDESWQLEIRRWCYGYMWDQCDYPRGSPPVLCFSIVSPLFPSFPPPSTCFFPYNLSLNFENVQHKKAFPSSSPISNAERGHLELEFNIAITHYLSSGVSLRPGLLVNGTSLTLPLGILEGHWAPTSE